MKIMIFGHRGFMGQRFAQLYPQAVCPNVDIADAQAVAAVLDAEKPDIVLNCAGKTGRPNVDWCETHKEETLRGNVTGPLVLLEELGKRGIYWMHLSSGCIYEGDGGGEGFSESDRPNFSGSFYSRTKAWSEAMLSECAASREGRGGILLLRMRMPFDGSTDERNLLMKLRKYSRVLDVANSVTYIPDFLNTAQMLIKKRATGIYNVVNEGAISPFEIMSTYKEIVDASHTFERLTIDHLSDVVRAGRSNCTLSTKKLREEGVTMRPVRKL